MKKFLEYIEEVKGGAEAGKLEVLSTSLNSARDFAEKKFSKNGLDLDKELPDFDKNYTLAQKSAKLGFAKRKDMPVIEPNEVPEAAKYMSKGLMDWAPPYKNASRRRASFRRRG